MAYRRLPNSTPAIVRTFKTAHDTSKLITNPAQRAISPTHAAQLDLDAPASLYSRLLKEASELDIAQAEQAPLTTALARLAARLTTYCSHFHQVFDLAIAREEFAPGDRSFYGRPATASTIPDLSDYDAVEDVADKIGEGEKKRFKAADDAGREFTAMTNPSAAQVTALLDPFREARAASQRAQIKTDKEAADLRALYQDAYKLAVDICDTVEFFYRAERESMPTFRTHCRRWGVVYIYEPSEPPDEGDTNAANTTLPGPGTPTPPSPNQP
jgi:hypothetical protein